MSTTISAPGITPYTGALEVGMVFDFEPGKKHKYERLVVEKKEGQHIWAVGRCGQTFHLEPEFRKCVVFVSAQYERKAKPQPAKLERRYEGPISVGMAFDFEPGKKHKYERLVIEKKEGEQIWAVGRCGQTFHLEAEFRDRIVPAT